GYKLGNIDITIIAQSPRLATCVKTMAENLAVVLNSNADQINIKATTTERLGYIGREEGIAVHCVVILRVQQ
ncbi:MAG: 2-C-methyl-D-erythritol 2,4-cyclodiphosphate synthase, partial [Gammaproteobacteria bacterium]